jgi:integral membrane sensor domain MASE1
MEEELIVFIVFASMTAIAVVIGLAAYFTKRLEHKQIMAAIEKGTPLSELVPPKPKPVGPRWIRYISSGILVLFIAFGFLLRGAFSSEVFTASILFGVAVSLIIRGLLYRKYYLKSQSANQNNAPPGKV